MGGVESCEPRNRSLHGSQLPGCGPARGSRAALCLTCCGRRSQVTRRPLAVGTERPCTSPWGHRGHADGLVGRNATCSVSCHSGGNPALCEVTSSVPVTSESRRGGQDSKQCLSSRSTCHGHLTSAVQGPGDAGGDWREQGTDVGKRPPRMDPRAAGPAPGVCGCAPATMPSGAAGMASVTGPRPLSHRLP